MSQENVEVIRKVFEAWNTGDLETNLAFVSPEWEWTTAGLFPGIDRVYRGREGAARFWRQFREPWASIEVELARVIDVGHQVLALMTFHAKGKEGRVDVTSRYANLFTLEEGLVIRQTGYATWEEALEAAGLSE